MKTLSKIFFLVVFVVIALAGCGVNTPNIPFLNSPTPTASNTPTPTNTVTPSPTPTATFTPTPTITPTPTPIGGGSGKVLFEYERAGFESEFPDLEGERNVFVADLDGSNLIPITNGLRGYNTIEALSPDGSKVLISSFSSSSRKKDARAILYVFDLKNLNAEPTEIAQGFSQYSYQPAAGWINESEIVYIGAGEKGYGIYRTDINGSEPIKIDVTVKTPERILATDGKHIYWSGSETKNYPLLKGRATNVWWIDLEGLTQEKLEINNKYVEYVGSRASFSPDGKQVAWIPSVPEPECNSVEKFGSFATPEERASSCFLLHIANLSDPSAIIKLPMIIPRDKSLDDIGLNYSYDYAISWSNDSSKVFLIDEEYRSFHDVFGDIPPKLLYINTDDVEKKIVRLDSSPLESSAIIDKPEAGRNPWVFLPIKILGFSFDEKQIIIRKWDNQKEYEIDFIDLDSMQVTDKVLQELNLDTVGSLFFLP